MFITKKKTKGLLRMIMSPKIEGPSKQAGAGTSSPAELSVKSSAASTKGRREHMGEDRCVYSGDRRQVIVSEVVRWRTAGK